MDISWLLSHTRPYRRYLIQNIVIVLVIVLINFTVPLTNRALVNYGVLTEDTGFVIIIIAVQVVLYALLISLHFLRSEIAAHISNRLIIKMVGEFMRHAVRLPMAYFNTGNRDLIERVRDFERIQRFASVELMEFTAAIISLMSLGPLLLWIDPSLFLVFAVTAIIYLLWILAYNKRRRAVDSDRFRADSAARAAEIGIIDAMQDIKIAGQERASLVDWERVQLDTLGTRLRAASIQHWQVAGGNAINRVGLLLISFISAREVINGNITLGDLTITTTISMQLYFHVSQILEFATKLQETTGALRRADELRQMDIEGAGVGKRSTMLLGTGVRIEDVGFTYEGTGNGALQGLSLNVKEGQIVAFVGPSGSGKSTLLKLLLNLYEPDRGTISIGGEYLTDIDLFYWRSRVAAVMQQGALFASSMRDNITAGLPLDEAWLAQVVALARLEDVIAAQPKGLETHVGPSGARLSAGQMQRLLIARAVYKRPSVLLLDEATSALDTVNEAAILGRLRSTLPNTTIIMVAHRLSAIKRVDRIFVIMGGRVTEQGTHEELMASEGFYWDLVQACA
jgi:ATP-binding cassette subfamily B protein